MHNGIYAQDEWTMNDWLSIMAAFRIGTARFRQKPPCWLI